MYVGLSGAHTQALSCLTLSYCLGNHFLYQLHNQWTDNTDINLQILMDDRYPWFDENWVVYPLLRPWWMWWVLTVTSCSWWWDERCIICSRDKDKRERWNTNKGGADKKICELLHAISDLVHQNTRIVSVARYIRNCSKLGRARGGWHVCAAKMLSFPENNKNFVHTLSYYLISTPSILL